MAATSVVFRPASRRRPEWPIPGRSFRRSAPPNTRSAQSWISTFGATLAAYQINQPNGIVNPVTSITGSMASSAISGLELNIFGQLWNELRVLGGFSLLDARLTQTAGGQYNGNDSRWAP